MDLAMDDIQLKIALMGCVGNRTPESLLLEVEEAVKENAINRLRGLLQDGAVSVEDLDRKNLLHQASWLGHPQCVKLLIEYGANPNEAHRKNGCTPLHLAHFCTVEDTNPSQTIHTLIGAGAIVNDPGSHKCGKSSMDHAIQHQRYDSVQELIAMGSAVRLQSILVCIDVANPQILSLLLLAGGDCSLALESTLYWGQVLHRVLYTPLKCPKECYKQMFKMLTQATVCYPSLLLEASREERRKRTNHNNFTGKIQCELESAAKDYVELTRYLYAALLRNGFHPPDSIRTFMKNLGEIEWVEAYLVSPPSLRELAMRTARSYLYLSGNIIYGVSQLDIPQQIKNFILLTNPL